MKGIGRAWILMAAALAACDEGMGPHVPELQVEDAILGARGDTMRLSARADGVLTQARWESLDPSVATVTPDGLVTAVAPGNVRVRASVSAARAEGTVTVLPAVDIRLSEVAMVTDAGGSVGVRMRIRNLGGRGYYALELWKLDDDGTRRRILRHLTETEAAPGMDIEHIDYLAEEEPDWIEAWSREPAALDPVRAACVRVDGAPGCPNDPAAVHSVLVVPGAHVLELGDSVQYRAHAYDEDGVEITGRSVVWSTPSPSVVALDGRGMLRALTKGYGQVDASIDGIEGSAALTVTEPPLRADPILIGPALRDPAVGAGSRVG